MSTLFVVEHTGKNTPSVISNAVRPENEWVFTDGASVTPTVKFDGTACAIIGGQLYKRYDAKHGKVAPAGAIPCGEPDSVTGHHPHWLLVDAAKSEDKWFVQGWGQFLTEHGLIAGDIRLGVLRDELSSGAYDGTYELCGERIGINAERVTGHRLIKHGSVVADLIDLSFDGIESYLRNADVEGIVFHHQDGRMCKIRKTDFGFKRG